MTRAADMLLAERSRMRWTNGKADHGVFADTNVTRYAMAGLTIAPQADFQARVTIQLKKDIAAMSDFDDFFRYSSIMMSSFYSFIFMGIYALASAVVIYIFVHVRDSRNARHDPQIGVKVALHYLMTVAILLALVGCSVVVVDQLLTHVASDDYSGRYRNTEVLTEPTKAGLGMVLAGALLAAGECWLLVSRTNDRKWPITRRTFNGARTVLHGLVLTVALTGLFVVAFVDMPDQAKENTLLLFTGLLFVWGFSAALHLTLLIVYTKQPNVPGDNFYCFECGDDLRGKVNETVHHCPSCKAVIPYRLKRAIAPAFPRPPAAGPGMSFPAPAARHPPETGPPEINPSAPDPPAPE